MTTLYGACGKKIQFSISDSINEKDKNTYIIESPIVICSNKRDAAFMQKEINTFVSTLSKRMLEGKEN